MRLPHLSVPAATLLLAALPALPACAQQPGGGQPAQAGGAQQVGRSATAAGPTPSSGTLQGAISLQDAFAAVAAQVTPAVVSVNIARAARLGEPAMAGSGSGFLVTPDGYILTNNHVVAEADTVVVALADRRVLPARVVGRDPDTDVAVIKIAGAGYPTLGFGSDDSLRVGYWVLAVGNPLGLDFTVTEGIVSAKNRNIPNALDAEQAQRTGISSAITDYIQTDAAINPGNSGGPLVNIRGEVVGINSAIFSPTGSYAGYGFAVPASLARAVMNDIIRYGRVRRPVLGLTLSDVSAPMAQRLGLREVRGALVAGISGPDSPAARAGVQPGDVILAVNGAPVDRVASLQRVIRVLAPGNTVTLGLSRSGRPLQVSVTLAELQTTPVAGP